MQKKSLFRMCTVMALLFVSLVVNAQETLIKGNVISATDNEAVIGLTVREKSTRNATVTDMDGNFSIKVSNADATLEFSYIGFVTQSLRASNGMKVIMRENTQALKEVVVTGYTSQRKADLTGAVAVVNVKETKTVPVTDPMQALQGKVAGMTITNSGDPASDATIQIRGIGTMNDNSPLYVIDGVPTKNSLHSLNANDIESIQVLKDAASASIYGSRAGNGVIIITTKRGKSGNVKIDFDMSYTASYYASHMKVCNTEQYGEAMFRAYTNSSVDPNSNALSYAFNWNKDYTNPVLNSMSFGKYDGYIDAEKTMLASNTNWFDEISRVGSLQNYSVSISNGTDKGSYLFSVGYKGDEGIIKYTDYNSISARMNSSYNLINNKATIGENFTTSYYTSVDQNQQNLALQALSIIPVHTVDGDGWGGPANGMNDRNNPLRLLYDGRNNRKGAWRMFGDAYLSIRPIKGLELKSTFGLDYIQDFLRTLTYSYKNGYLSNTMNNSELYQDHNLNWTWSNTATYNLSFGKNEFNFLLGTEAYKKTYTYIDDYRKTYSVESTDFMWPDAGTGDSYAGGDQSSYALLSYFGKIDYNYAEKYLASFTVRRDGSSKFGSNNRYGTFPAATLGWRISSEKFISDNKNLKWIDDLKLRVSWGKTGNQEGIDYYAHTGKWSVAYGSADPTWSAPNYTSYDMKGIGSGTLASGYVQTQRANANLKWGTSTQWNFGLDYTLLNNSLYGSFDYYIKKTTGILLSPSYIGVIGEGGPQYVNGASMQNKGWEFSMGYRKTLSNGLCFDIMANIDSYRNKVTSVPASVINNYGGNGANDNIIGHAYNSKYGYVADGLFRSQKEIDAYNSKYTYASGFVVPGLGRIRYADVNGDNVINEKDQTWIYNPTPDFSYGLNIVLSYKNFDLSMFWQGVQGVDYYNNEKFSTDFYSVSETGSNKGVRVLKAWSLTNTNSDIPALTYTNANNEGRLSTYFIENGSYLKLRTLQLGYILPKSIMKKFYMTNCRFYVNAENLLTIHASNFSATDPESSSWGYPIPTSMSVGLQVSF